MANENVYYDLEPVYYSEGARSKDPVQGALFTEHPQGILFSVAPFADVPGVHDAPVLSVADSSMIEQTSPDGENSERAVLATKSEFHDKCRDMVRYSELNGTPLSLLFADVDKFKLINDKYGHDEGDVMAEHLIDMFSQLPHTPGRVGGDEFALVAHVDEEGILAYKAHLQEAFGEILARPENAHLREIEGLGISIGIATFEQGMTSRDLLIKADKAMFAEKKSKLSLDAIQQIALRAAQLILEGAKIRPRDLTHLDDLYPLNEHKDSTD
jgi:diguanylate cyclase (GGDEF)-like protein